MEVLLRAEGVTKSFAHQNGAPVFVLQDLTLELNAGEVVCLLGASGSGKTTFLRLLAGIDGDYGGAIASTIQRPGPQLGYLPQNEKLLPWRSALGNVALGPELLGQPSEAARSALDSVGLSASADHFPSQLSGGMQQRVLLARTLALKPRLLLMDEPMSNLDVLARRDLSSVIKNYAHEQGAAALIVTHSVEEACFLADRILLMTRSPGRIFKEIVLGQGEDPSRTLSLVMQGLWQALEKAA